MTVIVEYVKPQQGIADKYSTLPTRNHAVVAQRLTEAALTEVLAGQQAYGLAEIRGQVLVFDNEANAAESGSVH